MTTFFKALDCQSSFEHNYLKILLGLLNIKKNILEKDEDILKVIHKKS